MYCALISPNGSSVIVMAEHVVYKGAETQRKENCENEIFTSNNENVSSNEENVSEEMEKNKTKSVWQCEVSFLYLYEERENTVATESIDKERMTSDVCSTLEAVVMEMELPEVDCNSKVGNINWHANSSNSSTCMSIKWGQCADNVDEFIANVNSVTRDKTTKINDNNNNNNNNNKISDNVFVVIDELVSNFTLFLSNYCGYVLELQMPHGIKHRQCNENNDNINKAINNVDNEYQDTKMNKRVKCACKYAFQCQPAIVIEELKVNEGAVPFASAWSFQEREKLPPSCVRRLMASTKSRHEIVNKILDQTNSCDENNEQVNKWSLRYVASTPDNNFHLCAFADTIGEINLWLASWHDDPIRIPFPASYFTVHDIQYVHSEMSEEFAGFLLLGRRKHMCDKTVGDNHYTFNNTLQEERALNMTLWFVPLCGNDCVECITTHMHLDSSATEATQLFYTPIPTSSSSYPEPSSILSTSSNLAVKLCFAGISLNTDCLGHTGLCVVVSAQLWSRSCEQEHGLYLQANNFCSTSSRKNAYRKTNNEKQTHSRSGNKRWSELERHVLLLYLTLPSQHVYWRERWMNAEHITNGTASVILERLAFSHLLTLFEAKAEYHIITSNEQCQCNTEIDEGNNNNIDNNKENEISLLPNAFQQVMRQTETQNMVLQFTTPCFLASVLRDVQHAIEGKQSTCTMSLRSEREKRGLLDCLVALFAATSHAIRVIINDNTKAKVANNNYMNNNIFEQWINVLTTGLQRLSEIEVCTTEISVCIMACLSHFAQVKPFQHFDLPNDVKANKETLPTGNAVLKTIIERQEKYYRKLIAPLFDWGYSTLIATRAVLNMREAEQLILPYCSEFVRELVLNTRKCIEESLNVDTKEEETITANQSNDNTTTRNQKVKTLQIVLEIVRSLPPLPEGSAQLHDMDTQQKIITTLQKLSLDDIHYAARELFFGNISSSGNTNTEAHDMSDDEIEYKSERVNNALRACQFLDLLFRYGVDEPSLRSLYNNYSSILQSLQKTIREEEEWWSSPIPSIAQQMCVDTHSHRSRV